jgi:hypothetical protein
MRCNHLHDFDDEARFQYDEREDEPDTAVDDDAEEGYCPNCSGSGEGMYDGSRCSSCKGSGVSK